MFGLDTIGYETRTYVGQRGTEAVDGWLGFRRGQQYTLLVERLPGRAVMVHHHDPDTLSPVELTTAEWTTWFRL